MHSVKSYKRPVKSAKVSTSQKLDLLEYLKSIPRSEPTEIIAPVRDRRSKEVVFSEWRKKSDDMKSAGFQGGDIAGSYDPTGSSLRSVIDGDGHYVLVMISQVI